MKAALGGAGALLLFVVMLVVLVAGSSCAVNAASASAAATKTVNPDDLPVDSVGPWNKDQLVVAAIIMNAAKDGGLNLRAQTIGVMTAMGESSLSEIDEGDAAGPDSRGPFQQRANGAWGSYEERMDTYTSATGFFGTGDHASSDGLIDIDGWEEMEPTLAASAVQRNANPRHYERFWSDAQDVVEALGEVDLARDGGGSSSPAQRDRSASNVNLDSRTKDHVIEAAEVISQEFGVTDMGGFRASNSRDQSGHPSGLALDVMVPLTDEGKALGDEISAWVIANAEHLNAKYVIWYQRIYHMDRPEAGWRDMSDRGSPTANHMDHPHISFTESANGDPWEAGTRDGSAAPANEVDECEEEDAGGTFTPPAGETSPGAWGGHDNGRIPDEALKEIPWATGKTLRADATDSLIAMNDAFKAEFGKDLGITGAYRPYQRQVELYAQYGAGRAATPGTSNHGWGLAVDFGTGVNRFGTPEHEWMRANGAQYGWKHPDWAQQGQRNAEAWHWEYWGSNE